MAVVTVTCEAELWGDSSTTPHPRLPAHFVIMRLSLLRGTTLS